MLLLPLPFTSSILRTGGGERGGVLISSMLRTGGRVEMGEPVAADDRLLTDGASPTSSMLRTGDLWLANGDDVRPSALAAAASALAFDDAWSKARTSLRSSSNTASRDMMFLFVIVVPLVSFRSVGVVFSGNLFG